MGIHRGSCCTPSETVLLHSAVSCPDIVLGSRESVSLEEFLPEVEVEARGVSRDLALWYIREACIEFAEETEFMRRREVLTLQKGVSDYFLTPIDGEQVLKLTGVCYHGRAVDTKSLLRGHDRGVSVSFQPPYQLRLNEEVTKDCDYCAAVDYVALPDRNACDVDRQFSRRYHSAIVTGALAKLLGLTRGKDGPHVFHNPNASEKKTRDFQKEKARAKTDVALQFISGARMSTFSRAQLKAGF